MTEPARRYRVIVTTPMTVIVAGDEAKDTTEDDDRRSLALRWGDRLVDVIRLDEVENGNHQQGT